MKLKELRVENGYHWIEPIEIAIQSLYSDIDLFNLLNGCCLYYKKSKPNFLKLYGYSDQTIPFSDAKVIEGYLNKFIAFPDNTLIY